MGHASLHNALRRQLQAAHGADSSSRMGVDVVRGEAGDMKELGIYESFRVRQQVGRLWVAAARERAAVRQGSAGTAPAWHRLDPICHDN